MLSVRFLTEEVAYFVRKLNTLLCLSLNHIQCKKCHSNNPCILAPVTVRQILIFAVIAFTSYSILCALQSKFYFARHPIECIERWIVKTYNEYFNKPEEKVIPVQFRGWYNSRGNYKPGVSCYVI